MVRVVGLWGVVRRGVGSEVGEVGCFRLYRFKSFGKNFVLRSRELLKGF